MPSTLQPTRISWQPGYPPLEPEYHAADTTRHFPDADSINAATSYFEDPESDLIYLGPPAYMVNGLQRFGPLLWSSNCSSLSELRDSISKSGEMGEVLPNSGEITQQTLPLYSEVKAKREFVREWMSEVAGRELGDKELRPYKLEMKYAKLNQDREQRVGESVEAWTARVQRIVRILRKKGMYDGDLEPWREGERAEWEDEEEQRRMDAEDEEELRILKERMAV